MAKFDTQRGHAVRTSFAKAHGPLMYGSEALAMRRCTGLRLDGSPCRAWAEWGSPQQRCTAHSGRPRRTRAGCGNSWPYMPRPTKPARYEPCRCIAYAWPHRPASGLCCWPFDPMYRLTTPAGTHRRGRDRSWVRGWSKGLDELIRAQKAGRWPRRPAADFEALLPGWLRQ